MGLTSILLSFIAPASEKNIILSAAVWRGDLDADARTMSTESI
jgi:hypothetical protein